MSSSSKQPIKVSIITIVYNNVSTLEQTILSVIHQSYQHIEYIVIDGNSSDGSVDIIKKHSAKIARWISEPDKGISDAFNKGLALATGDVIGIINADDWFAENAIETVVGNLSSNYDVYCGNITLIGSNSQVLRVRKSKVDWLNYGMYVMHPSVFVNKHVYERVGKFNTGFRIAMDFDMMLRIKKEDFKIRYIDQVIASMRVDGVSRDKKKMHREELIVMKRNLGRITYVKAWSFNYFNRIFSPLYSYIRRVSF